MDCRSWPFFSFCYPQWSRRNCFSSSVHESSRSSFPNFSRIHEADNTYRLGIARKVTPLERLERNYARFKDRVVHSRSISGVQSMNAPQLTYEDIMQESIRAARTQPPAGMGPLRVRSGGPGGLSMRESNTRDPVLQNNGARAPVLEDRDEKAGFSRVRDPWVDIGTRASRKQENSVEPGKMVGTHVGIDRSMVRRRGGVGGPLAKQDVFQDDDDDDDAASASTRNGPQTAEHKEKAKEGDELKRNPFKHWSTGIKLTPSAEDLALPGSSSHSKNSGKDASRGRGEGSASRQREHHHSRSEKDKRGSSSRHHSSSSSRSHRSHRDTRPHCGKEKEWHAVPLDLLYPSLASRLRGEKAKASDLQKLSHDTGERSIDEVLVAQRYPSAALSDTLDPWSHLDATVGKWMPDSNPQSAVVEPRLQGGFLMAVDEEDEDMDMGMPPPNTDLPARLQHFSNMVDRTPLASKRSLAIKAPVLGERLVLASKDVSSSQATLREKLLDSKAPVEEESVSTTKTPKAPHTSVLGDRPLAVRTPTLREQRTSAKTPVLGEKPSASKTPSSSGKALASKTPVLGEKPLPSKMPILGEKAISSKTPALVEKPKAAGPPSLNEKQSTNDSGAHLGGPAPLDKSDPVPPSGRLPLAPKSVLGKKRAAQTPKGNAAKRPVLSHEDSDAGHRELPSLPSPGSREPLFAPTEVREHSRSEHPPEPREESEEKKGHQKRPPSPTVVTKAAMAEVENMFNGDDGEDSSEDSDSDSDSDEDEDSNEDSDEENVEPQNPVTVHEPEQAAAPKRAASKLQIFEDETDIFAPPRQSGPETAEFPATPSNPVAAPAALTVPGPPQSETVETVAQTPLPRSMVSRPLAQQGAPNFPAQAANRSADVREEDEEEEEEEEEYGAPASLLANEKGEEMEENDGYPRALSPITEVTEFTRYTAWGPSPATSRHSRTPRLSIAPYVPETLDHGRVAPRTPSGRVLAPRAANLPPVTPSRTTASLPNQTKDFRDSTKCSHGGTSKASSLESETASVPSTPPVQIPNPCTPDDPDILNALLAQLSEPLEAQEGFVDFSSQRLGKKLDSLAVATQTRGKESARGADATATVKFAAPIELGGSMFRIVEKIGEGGFANVYLAQDLDRTMRPTKASNGSEDVMANASMDSDESGSDDGTQDLVAIKAETPANRWELHCLRKAEKLLAGTRTASSVVRAHRFVAYEDASVLLLDYLPQGTLLNLVNHAQDAGVAARGEGGLEELLAMFFTIELMRTVESLHNVGIIHGDVKVDNCLLRVAAPAGSVYSAEGQDGWADAGLSLVDFGRSIDTALYPSQQVYKAGWKPEARDIPAIRAGYAWKYEADYMGIAAVAHTLLFGKYLDTISDKDGRVRLTSTIRRYWNESIWSEFFSLMLNPSRTVGEPCMAPLLPEFRAIRQRMEQHLTANGNRGGKVCYILLSLKLN